MKIKDLKELIKDLPDHMEVMVYLKESSIDNFWEGIARKASKAKTKHVKDLKIAQRACKETVGSKKCFVLY